MLTILYINDDSPQLTPQITTNSPLVHHSWVVLPRIPPKILKKQTHQSPIWGWVKTLVPSEPQNSW